MTIKTFTWTAPTEREDGSPLDPKTLMYQLYIDGTAVAAFPGSLNPDGTYAYEREFQHGEYTVFLTTLDEDGRESVPSNTVTFSVASAPGRPTALAVS